MAHWLVKSEPNVFSWDDLAKSGAKGSALVAVSQDVDLVAVLGIDHDHVESIVNEAIAASTAKQAHPQS